jgi:DNA-directed RNA polymerase specialized sigma24 family protein
MKEWRRLIEQAQEGHEASREKILEKLEPKINKSLRQTTYQNREDLKQELIIKTLTAIQEFDTCSVPGFWHFVQETAPPKAARQAGK